VLHHVCEIETTMVLMHMIIVVIIASDKLLFFGLVRWSDTLRPHIWVITILLTQLRCFLFTLFIVGHWQVIVLLIRLVLEAMGVPHVHVFLKKSLDFALIGFVIIDHDSVTRVYKTTALALVIFLFLVILLGSRSVGRCTSSLVDCIVITADVTLSIVLVIIVDDWLATFLFIMLLSLGFGNALAALLADVVNTSAHSLVDPELANVNKFLAKAAFLSFYLNVILNFLSLLYGVIGQFFG